MSDVFITRRGTGSAASGAAIFAAIGVAYPQGSQCSCRKGTKILRAADTGGQAAFAIAEAGLWTVAISKSEDGVLSEKSLELEIKAEDAGKLFSLSLGYEQVLLDEKGLADGYSIEGCTVVPAIDLTNYSKLELVGRLTWHSSEGLGINWGLSQAIDGELEKSVLINDYTQATYTIDVSELSGLYYFAADIKLSLEEEGLVSSHISESDQGMSAVLTSIVLR